MTSDRDYALLCQAAYQGVPDYGTPDGARAFRASIGGRLVICFPGSRSLQDWAVDLLAPPALDLDRADHVDLGPIHVGFLERAHRCLDLVRIALLAADGYVLTGHSLGGAIALLVAALMMAEKHPPPFEIVTFGAPRVGLRPWARILTAVNIRQYRFGADVIPLVPTYPYQHAREPLIQVGEPIKSLDIFINHAIVNYIGALN